MTAKPQFLAAPGRDDGKWIFESIFAALKTKLSLRQVEYFGCYE
jgi:hypothetical protein